MKKCYKCPRSVTGLFAIEEQDSLKLVCGFCLGLPKVTDEPVDIPHEGDIIVKRSDNE